jgi:hypothetical protein
MGIPPSALLLDLYIMTIWSKQQHMPDKHAVPASLALETLLEADEPKSLDGSLNV